MMRLAIILIALSTTTALAEWDNYRPMDRRDYQRDWAIMADMVACDERAADTLRYQACMDAVQRKWRGR